MKKLLLYIVVLLNITIYAQDKETFGVDKWKEGYIKPYFGVWEYKGDYIVTRWNKKVSGGTLYFVYPSNPEIDEETIYIGKDSLITSIRNIVTKEANYGSYKLKGKRKLVKTTYSSNLYMKEIIDVVVYKLIKN
jgi:hypothetical protein